MKNLSAQSRTTLFILVFAAALALAAAPVSAQSGNAGGAAGQQSQPGGQNFTDQTLESFASAQVELRQIQDTFAEKLQGVQDQKKAMSIQQEMNEKMVKAVQGEGLDVPTYNAVANQLNVDEELRSKVEKMMQQQ